EARRLVRAASGQAAIREPFTYINGNEYGSDYRRDIDILQGMWQNQGDFAFNANVVDYNSVFLPRFSINIANRTCEGGGVAMGGVVPFPEPDILFGEWYMPGGTYYKFEPDYPADPRWDSLMKSQRSEFDPAKRVGLLQEIQRYHASKMFTI